MKVVFELDGDFLVRERFEDGEDELRVESHRQHDARAATMRKTDHFGTTKKVGEREEGKCAFRWLSPSATSLARVSVATMVQLTTPDTPAKKKHKVSQNPFASAFSRLVDKLELFASFLASNAVAPSPALYLNQLGSIEEEIAEFKREKPGNERELGTKWKDKLDSLGTLYWNQSTALRHAVVKDSDGEVDALRVVAHCSSILS